jgi:hypothetical protein
LTKIEKFFYGRTNSWRIIVQTPSNLQSQSRLFFIDLLKALSMVAVVSYNSIFLPSYLIQVFKKTRPSPELKFQK